MAEFENMPTGCLIIESDGLQHPMLNGASDLFPTLLPSVVASVDSEHAQNLGTDEERIRGHKVLPPALDP